MNKYLISLCPVQGVRVGGGHQIIDSRVARKDSCWIQIIDVKLGGSVTDSSLGLNCPPIRETKSQWPIQVKGEQHMKVYTFHGLILSIVYQFSRATLNWYQF